MTDDTTDTSPPTFKLAQIYVTRATFTHRGKPLLLDTRAPIPPQRIAVGLSIEHMATNDGRPAAQIRVSVATDPEESDETVRYDFDVELAGIVEDFDRSRLHDPELVELVGAMIFPFMRETVANLTGRGRFGPVLLNPFNVRDAVRQTLRGQTKRPEPEKEKGPTS